MKIPPLAVLPKLLILKKFFKQAGQQVQKMLLPMQLFYRRQKRHLSKSKRLINLVHLVEKHLSHITLTSLVCILLIGVSASVYRFITPPLNPDKPIFQKNWFNASQLTANMPSVGMKTTFQAQAKTIDIAVSRANSKLELAIPFENAQATIDPTNPSKMVFSDEKSQVSVKYQALKNGIKEDIILNSDPNTNLFATTLKTHNLRPVVTQDKQIYFVNSKGEYQFEFEQPYAQDKTGNTTYAVQYHLFEGQPPQNTQELSEIVAKKQQAEQAGLVQSSQAGTPDISKLTAQLLGGETPIFEAETQTRLQEIISLGQPKTYTLVLEVQKDWLMSPERVYPLLIDPTIVHDESSEFATGTLANVVDTGSGVNPSIESFYREAPYDVHTRAYYKMDETSGSSVADLTGNGFTGTATGTTIVDSMTGFDKARSFSGSDVITVSSPLTYNRSRTISFWFRPTALGTQRGLISAGNSSTDGTPMLLFVQTSANLLSIYHGSGYRTGTTLLTSNRWYHAAYTFDASNNEVKLYLDGNLEFSGIAADSNLNNTNMYIGRGFNASFNGNIDEVKIDTIARKEEDIKAMAKRPPVGRYTSTAQDLGPALISIDSLEYEATSNATDPAINAPETPFSSTGLVAQWNFNETSGTTAVSGGSCGTTCNGTLTGFTDTTGQDTLAQSGWTSTQRKSGVGALMFDGSNDYVINTPNNTGISGNAELSFEAWVNPTGGTGIQTIVGLIPVASTSGHAGALLINPNGARTIGFHFNNGGQNTGQVLELGKWQHIVVTKTPGTLTTTTKIYLNGVEQPTVNQIGNITPNITATKLQIGAGWWNSATSYPFNGILDTVRVYSRALTQDEVQANYNMSRVMFETRTSADGSTWEEWRPTGSPVDITIDAWNDIVTNSIDSETDTTLTNNSADSRKIVTSTGGARYVVDRFTTTGAGTWNRPTGVTEVDVLVVAGGGGGGGVIGGGGGGGGVVYQTGVDVSSSPTVSVTVGAGGAGGTGFNTAGQQGGKGGNSVFGSITATGGGGGGPIGGNSSCNSTISNGGSGGGAAAGLTTCWGTGTSGQGYNGGAGAAGGNNSGGGGGATEPGAFGTDSVRSGNGGSGITSDILGYSGTFGGGGGGGTRSGFGVAGSGGAGGGGAGTTTTTLATAGTVNTGGGGGGGGYNGDTAGQVGGNGGSGIVIVRYLEPSPEDTIIGHWSFDETTVEPAYYIESFTTAGSHTWYKPSDVTEVDLLIVGGGGGGGGVIGGGGGAGGMHEEFGYDVSNDTSFAISVGGGGGGGNGFNTATQAGTKGGSSQFEAITVQGGGGGGPIGGNSSCNSTNSNGGSGGGAAAGLTTCWGTGVSGQGNNGGTGAGSNNGGGGGGAGGVGANASLNVSAGNGGPGKVTNFTGLHKIFAAGGGGGTRSGNGTAGAGGAGGGGAGTTTTTLAGFGAINTGSGGGGAGHNGDTTNKVGGDGGSGIVVVRYQSNFPNPGAEPIYETKDYSGNNHHGTYKNTSITRGVVGNARSFNGSTSGIALPSSADFSIESVGVEAWVYASDFNQTGMIYQKASVDGSQTIFSCGITGSTITFITRSSPSVSDSLTVSNTLQRNSWNHIVCSYNKAQGSKNIWINGAFAGSIAYTQTLYHTSTDRQSIGTSLVGDYYGTPANFNGKIDEVKVFDASRRSYQDMTEAYQLGHAGTVPFEVDINDTLNKDIIAFDIAADRPGTYLELTGGDNYQSTLQPDPSLTLGYWKFDETYRTRVIDYSANKNDAFLNANISRSEGVIGNSAYFTTGSSHYANLQTNFGQPTQFSLSLWFKTNQTTTRALVGQSQFIPGAPATASRVPTITITSTGQVRGEFWTGSVGAITSPAGFNDNRWHQVVMVADATTQYLYVDGQLIGSRVGTIDHSWWYVTTIGAGYGSTTRGFASDGWSYFTGYIDEVRVDDTTWSAAQIRQMYEAGARQKSFPITISFGAKLDSANPVTNSSDYLFTIDATHYQLPQKGSNVFAGDRIIIKENVDGTTYIAQGIVSTVTATTGNITVQSWDAGSTFPAAGFTNQADVFKWERQYWDAEKTTGISNSNFAITNMNLHVTNGNEGRIIWVDNLQARDNALTDPTGSIPTSTTQQYFQYRTIFMNSDSDQSAALESVTLNYTVNEPPAEPSLDSPGDAASGVSTTPTLLTTTTDPNSDAMQYRIILCENLAMTTNCQTFDQSVSQTGWSGQNALSSTGYTSGTQGNYTLQSQLSFLTTYYWKSQAKDPNGSDTWGDLQTTPYSFTTNNNNTPTVPTDLRTNNTTNPTAITTLVPTFSAQYNDPDVTDQAVSYQIQIGTTPSFAPGAALWSGALSPYVDEGDRTAEIDYSGPALTLNGQSYYWRIRLTDENGSTSPWSTETATFSMFNLARSSQCTIQQNPLNTTFTVAWTDETSGEDGYELERRVNAGSWTLLDSPAANATSYADSTIAQGSTYQYRVRSTLGSEVSEWCTTATLSPNIGDFFLEGINFSGVNIN